MRALLLLSIGLVGCNQDYSFSEVPEPLCAFTGLVKHRAGPAGDVDGDGYDDVFMSAGANAGGDLGSLCVIAGGPEGLSNRSLGQLDADEALYQLWASSLGDVNGDGYDDLGVIFDGFGVDVLQVQVFHGGPEGLSESPSWTVPAANYNYVKVVAAGDVDGDGYDDVLVHGRDLGSVYLGSADGLAAEPSWALDLAPNDVGIAATGAVDVNGDGYDDVVMGHTRHLDSEGAVHVYLGGPLGPSTTIDQTVAGRNRFGHSVASAGDLDGDGFDDLVIGSAVSGADEVTILRGSPGGLVEGWQLAGELVVDNEGLDVAVTVGDTDRDGYDDLGVVWRLPVPGSDALVTVFRGGPDGPSTVPDWSQRWVAGYSITVAGAGDVNGDGYADVITAEKSSINPLWFVVPGVLAPVEDVPYYTER